MAEPLVHDGFFDAPLARTDPELAACIHGEHTRQRDQIELIASENLVSRALLEAQGSLLTNKTVEGYPGRRYYGGAEWADAVERLAIERARRLFGARHANVQPHSGSQANQAVYLALLRPGEPILSMALAAGGHLSHGAPANQSGKWFAVRHYGVRREDGRIDLGEVERLAAEHRPRLLIAGGSAYPRVIDFARFRAIAEGVGAVLLVDMAHFAGLVAGRVHPSPVGHAQVVTSTTYKSLRGARGGFILCDDEALARRIDAAVFPGLQGSVQLHGVAAKAVTFGEALRPEFAAYARAVRDHARVLAETLIAEGIEVVSGGTDTALLLVDLRPLGLTGDAASARLELAGLTCNKNAVPFDPEPPTRTSGLRLSSATATTRGLGREEFVRVGTWIAELLHALARDPDDERPARAVRAEVEALCARHPIYPSAGDGR